MTFSQPRYKPTPEIERFIDEDEYVWSMIEKYEKYALMELLNEYSSLWDDQKTPDDKTVSVLKALIADKLDLTPRGELHFYDEWFIHEELVPTLKKMYDDIQKLKTHRHDTTKSYSEKPVY